MVDDLCMPASDGLLLCAAARTIEADAQDLKRSHTLRGEWIELDDVDRSAKAEYDSRMKLAAELRERSRGAPAATCGSLPTIDEATLRLEFERMHSNRRLTRHHLRGTYQSPPIAALWNQHVKTATMFADVAPGEKHERN